jgi:hypothetical protein
VVSSPLRLVLLLTGLLGSPGPDIPFIQVSPTDVSIEGSDSVAQIIVTFRSDRHSFDLTASAQYSIKDTKVAKVDPDGLVHPVRDGETWIEVSVHGKVAWVHVVISDMANKKPVNFVNEVVPILTKFGCNAGGCHGKSIGQNGFKLSLLGFDPKSDYDALVREGRGRRVFPADPGKSLFLKKPSAQVPHGGGKRFPVGSPEFQTIARWIAQGTPSQFDVEEPLLDFNALVQLEVEPDRRVIHRNGRQQLRVVATYADGMQRDITRLAQYQSNASDLAIVGDTGVVETLDGVGEAAIMARFGGQVGVSRVVVPLTREAVAWEEPKSSNLVDPLVFKKLRELGLSPSEACTDNEFARRSSLDICGILPDQAEVSAFEKDNDPAKREKWVDRLIERPEYADLFAMKWSAILKNKRALGPVSQAGTFAFHGWIRQSIAENKPYDKFVSEIVAARGEPTVNPAVLWYRQVNTLEARVDDTAQLFLGMRIQCARCHHHPFERWSQDDYYGFASLFTRIGNKGEDPSTPRLYVLAAGLATNPITGQEKAPKPLGGPEMPDLKPGDDPREKLADWLREKNNPYFARALVNRYWKHFMGRGLVEPEDDMRVSNPPSNPELLDGLAASFVESGYDLKALVRLIATSKAYDRSSLPNATNARDRRNFARFYAKRLPAEVLLDALNLVAGTREPFAGLPEAFKATQLPDDGFDSEFLTIFGRPKRESVCECERSSEANLSQTLHLLNSSELQGKLGSGNGRASKWLADKRPDREKVDELYRVALSRPPTADEREVCLAHLEKRRTENKLKQGYEDLVWAIVNSKEFLFIQ